MEYTALSLQFMFVLPVSYSRTSVTVLVVCVYECAWVCVCVGGCQRSVSSLASQSLLAYVQYIPHVHTFHMPFRCASSILCCVVGPQTRFCYHAAFCLLLARAAFFVSVLCAPNWLCEFFGLVLLRFVPFRFVVFHFVPTVSCLRSNLVKFFYVFAHSHSVLCACRINNVCTQATSSSSLCPLSSRPSSTVALCCSFLPTVVAHFNVCICIYVCV